MQMRVTGLTKEPENTAQTGLIERRAQWREKEEGRELSGLVLEQQAQQKLSAEQVEGGDGTDTTAVSLEYWGKCCQMLAVHI